MTAIYGSGVGRLLLGAVTAVLIACSPPSTGPTKTPPVTGSTPPPIEQLPDIVLVGAGDIAHCKQTGAVRTGTLMEAALAKYPNATAFTAGDNTYETGTPTEFRECYDPSWGKFKARTRPVPGNHEYSDGGGAGGYFSYFGGNAGSSGLGYYAYTLGDWRIITLNSELLPGGGPAANVTAAAAQMQWLKDELAANHHNCTAAIWHRPLFSSSRNGNQLDVKPLYKALYDANVDVIINGHDHVYERFGPQDPDTNPDSGRGIRQFVVGSGGAELYRDPHPTQRNSQRLITEWGILALTLRNGSYLWEFTQISDDGAAVAVTDSGSDSCH